MLFSIESFLVGKRFRRSRSNARVTIARTEGVAFSSHSFLAFAAGVTPDGGSTVLALSLIHI